MAEDITAGSDGSPAAAAGITEVNVSSAEGPLGKLAEAADHIADLLSQERGRGLLHVVFDDRGRGDAPDRHGQLRQLLSARGVSWAGIRLLRDAEPELSADCRNGAVTVLIASSEQAGVAAAVTRGRQIGIHHLDVPRDGLAARQREQLMSTARAAAPLAFRYFTAGTFDELRWAAFDRKKEFIDQVMRGTPDIREYGALGAAPVQASFPGANPLANGTPESRHVPDGATFTMSGQLAARVLESIEEMGNEAPFPLKELWGVINAARSGLSEEIQNASSLGFPGTGSPARPGSARRRGPAGSDGTAHRGEAPTR